MRFWIEAGAAAASGLLAIVTLFWRDWIEIVTGWDPDQHSGWVEWLAITIWALIVVGSALLARAEWRRPLALA